MDSTLPRNHTVLVGATIVERGRAKYQDPGFALAVAQLVFVLAAEAALVLMLVMH